MNAIKSTRLALLIVCSLWLVVDGNKSIRRVNLDRGLVMNITVGYPKPQKFSVALNTASAITWVVGKQCQSAYCQTRTNSFDPSQSRTFNNENDKRWKASAGIGVVFEGALIRETVGLGGGLVGDQLVGVLETCDGWMDDHLVGFDGVLGLGSRLSPVANNPGLIQSMSGQQLIPDELFSLHVAKLSVDNQQTGELILGGIDRNYFTGDIIYVPVINRWTFYVDYMSVPGSDLKHALQTEALIDSSANVILAPKRVVQQVASLFGVEYDRRLDLYYFVLCDEIPNVQFNLFVNGMNLALSASDLVIKLKSGGHSSCYLALDINKAAGWLLGTPFLRKYYTIFDQTQKRLGFALSV